MVERSVAFRNQGIRLAGTLYKSETKDPHPALVVLHAANGGTRSFPFYQHLQTRLPQHGIATLVYDRRGSGESGGRFETSNFDDLAADACAAIDCLRTQDDIAGKRIGVLGISQGGWIAPMVAGRRRDVTCVVVVSGCGVSPAAQMNFAAAYNLRKFGFPDVVVARAIRLRNQVNEYYRGRSPRDVVAGEVARARGEPWFAEAYLGAAEQLPQNVSESAWYHQMDYDPLPPWQHVQQPVLFVFAEEDRWVPVAESMANFKRVTEHIRDSTMVRIDGTDHLMMPLGEPATEKVVERYIERLVTWLAPRLDAKG